MQLFSVSSQENILSSNNKKLDNIRAKMMRLKSFLMNEIYDLQHGLAQIQSKDKQEKKISLIMKDA